MDFGTLKKKLEHQDYLCGQDCITDFKLLKNMHPINLVSSSLHGNLGTEYLQSIMNSTTMFILLFHICQSLWKRPAERKHLRLGQYFSRLDLMFPGTYPKPYSPVLPSPINLSKIPGTHRFLPRNDTVCVYPVGPI